MTFDNFACRTQRHGPDDFLAYCRSLRYGDYEHGALYYGLERKARESIQTAQVLFLGSSRLQAAFAANAIRGYFRARDIRNGAGLGAKEDWGPVTHFWQP
jgi:hypothetical protein